MESTHPKNNHLKNRHIQDKLPVPGVTNKRSIFNSSNKDDTNITQSKKLCTNEINKPSQVETPSNNNTLHHDIISGYPSNLEVLDKDTIPLELRYFNNCSSYLRGIVYNTLKNYPDMSPRVSPKVSNHLLMFQ
ncbi:uncharacterized protein LOC112592748, partial [Melanaphis sacchari]|uniref:uncharacterized protein LOC112592748 n=1 Tax=Melanaphis sacchari TaxID=742174 RepID=UPI000DC15746